MLGKVLNRELDSLTHAYSVQEFKLKKKETACFSALLSLTDPCVLLLEGLPAGEGGTKRMHLCVFMTQK